MSQFIFVLPVGLLEAPTRTWSNTRKATMASTTTKPCSAATGLIYLGAKPRSAPCIASSNPFVHSLSLPITRQILFSRPRRVII